MSGGGWRRRPLGKPDGFTLVELMIALVVAGLAAVAAVTVFSAQNKAADRNAAQTDAQQNARAAVDQLTRELRMAGTNLDKFHKQNALLDAAPYQVVFSGDCLSGVGQDAAMDATSTVPLSTGGNYVPGAFLDENLEELDRFNNGAETIRYSFDTNGDGVVTLADSLTNTPGVARDFQVVREVNGGEAQTVAQGLRGPVVRPDGTNPAPLFQYWGLFAGATTLKLWGDANHDGALSTSEVGSLTPVSQAELKNIREIVVSVEAVANANSESVAGSQQSSTVLTTTVRPRNIGLNSSNLSACGNPPYTPSSLSAIDTPEDAGRSITITFPASYDDTGGENDVREYSIYRRRVGQSSFGAPIFHIKAADASSYSFINDQTNSKKAEDAPEDGVQYEYYVTAWDCEPQESNPSDIAGPVASQPNGPQPPTITTAFDTPCDAGDDITIAFQASTDDNASQGSFTGYRVYRGTSSNITAYKVRVIDVTAAHAPTYTVHDVSNSLLPMAPDSTYYYVVRAVRREIESVDSNQFGPVYVSDGVARPALQLVEDMPADFGERLKLTWDASPSEACSSPNNVQEYVVRRRAVNGSTFLDAGRVTASARPTYVYADTLLNPATTYEFYVTAVDAGGHTADSNKMSGRGTAENQLLPPLSVAAADDPCDPNGAIRVTFLASPSDAVGDATHYRIWRGTTAGSYNYELTRVDATGASTYTILDDQGHSGSFAPALGTTYYYMAKSYNEAYDILSTVSNESSALAEATPTAPVINTAIDTPNDGGRSITVSFRRSDHDGSCDNTVTSYKVYRGTSASALGTNVGTVTAVQAANYTFADNLVYSLDAPVDGVQYYYGVRAYAGTLVSRLSNVGGPVASVHDGVVNTAIWTDNFETDMGWTHGATSGTDNWQRAIPAGLSGTALGYPDPAAAAGGTYVIGTKLTGANGIYSRNSSMWIQSPKIDCHTAANVQLVFKRWLNVEKNSRDVAEIYVRSLNNGWSRVWRNGTSSTAENAWSNFTLDITSIAGAQREVQVQFWITSNSSNDYTGWNIDDLKLEEF